MEICREDARSLAHTESGVTLFDYAMQDAALCGAVALIRGRYPETGFVVNRKVKEMVYVLAGRGNVETAAGPLVLAQGDVVLLDKDEAFAWGGDMDLFIVTTPRFDVDQYERLERLPSGSA